MENTSSHGCQQHPTCLDESVKAGLGSRPKGFGMAYTLVTLEAKGRQVVASWSRLLPHQCLSQTEGPVRNTGVKKAIKETGKPGLAFTSWISG